MILIVAYDVDILVYLWTERTQNGRRFNGVNAAFVEIYALCSSIWWWFFGDRNKVNVWMVIHANEWDLLNWWLEWGKLKIFWSIEPFFFGIVLLYLKQKTFCCSRSSKSRNKPKTRKNFIILYLKKTTRKILITHYKSHKNSSRNKKNRAVLFHSSSQPHNLCFPNSIRHNSSAFSHFMHTNKHNKT